MRESVRKEKGERREREECEIGERCNREREERDRGEQSREKETKRERLMIERIESRDKECIQREERGREMLMT